MGETLMIGRFAGAVALGALAMGFVAQASAQKPPPPEEVPAKVLTGPNTDVIKEGMAVIHEAGECKVTYIISKQGKLKNPKADCTIPEMAPYALRAMESMTFQANTFDGSSFDSDEMVQPFKWAASGGAAPAAGNSAPVVKTPPDNRTIGQAIERIKSPGKCDATFTVGVDGKPKDIKANCAPKSYDSLISKAISGMVYTPGMAAGKPVETPNVEYPINLGAK
jgi:hypothetical protein